MKVLLIGEYSGVHNNLKDGLLKKGIEVKLLADGDGYKEFKYDEIITPYNGGVIQKIRNLIYIIKKIKMIHKYDIVQIINPFIFPLHYFYSGIVFLIFLKAKKIIYYACGTDPIFLASESQFSYFPFDKNNPKNYRTYNLYHNIYFKYFISKISIVIASNYSYEQGWKVNKKYKNIIPLPASIIKYKINKYDKNYKIKILFGITRRETKGASFILKALELINRNQSSKVKIEIVENLNYEAFFEKLSNCDLLIDQCRSYDYGMSAITALQMGVITMSGAESIAINSLNDGKCPVINIKPSVKDIYRKILVILNMSEEQINELKESSQYWAYKIHRNSFITEKFISIYEN